MKERLHLIPCIIQYKEYIEELYEYQGLMKKVYIRRFEGKMRKVSKNLGKILTGFSECDIIYPNRGG